MKIIRALAISRAKEKLKQIEICLKRKDAILDIGTGNGSVCYLLQKLGYSVQSLDIIDISLYPDIKPQIYDGRKIPYKNNKFDVALLLTVLHHIQKPEQVLLEVVRVAKKVIIIEEVYSNYLQKIATFITDSIFNLEFVGHPHSNKTDQQWKQCFKENNLKLLSSSYSTSLWFLQRVTYVVCKN